MYEYDTNTSLKELKFTLDSTLGEILDEPLGMKMMEEMLPELVHNPMIEYARRMTLAEGISSAPEVKAVYEAVLKELNAQKEKKVNGTAEGKIYRHRENPG